MPIMTDEPKEPHVENIPSVSGKISAIASANAPFIYFEDARFFGVVGGWQNRSIDVPANCAELRR
jgi:hypothetical protein